MERRPIKKRLGEAIAALLMWAFFGAATLFLLVAFPLLIIRYIVTGKPGHRDAVKLPGKALDQVVNCAYFSGHPKETISSHAGRWLFEKHGLPVPWWAEVVARITDVFEEDHVIKAIEAPFLGQPLGRK